MKIVAPLFGTFILLLVGLMFWWLYWQDEAEAHTKNVASQLKVLERFWNNESFVDQGRLKIGYEDIAESGFPFGMRVRLLKPYLRDERGEAVFTITTNYIDILPQDEAGTTFTLEYPDEGHAIIRQGSSEQRYYLHLSSKPQIWARKTEVQGEMPSAVNEYGMIAPPHLLFTADSGGKLKRYPMKLTSTEEILWRPLFRNLRGRLGSLRGLLRRGMMGL